MTKADLINEITIETGFDKKTVSMIVERMMTEIKGSLIKGENVYLRGFGSLVLKKRKAKVARNISRNTTVLVHRTWSLLPSVRICLTSSFPVIPVTPLMANSLLIFLPPFLQMPFVSLFL